MRKVTVYWIKPLLVYSRLTLIFFRQLCNRFLPSFHSWVLYFIYLPFIEFLITVLLRQKHGSAVFENYYKNPFENMIKENEKKQSQMNILKCIVRIHDVCQYGRIDTEGKIFLILLLIKTY